MIPNVKPYIPKEDIPSILSDIEDILTTRKLILGPYLKRFEDTFAKFVGSNYCIGLSSATSALMLLFQYLNVKNREVVMPSLNFISDANAVLLAGGNPIFCDTKKNSLLPSLDNIKEKVTDKTKGIVLVNICGSMNSELEQIKIFAKDNGLFLIEDASHSHGSEVNGERSGIMGDAAVFSMYPTKIITSSSGGVVTTNDQEIFNFLISVRHYGQGRTLFDCKTLGGGWYMPEMNCVLGYYQLLNLPKWLKKRRDIAKVYDKAFATSSKIYLIKEYGISSYYKYQILLDSNSTREKVKKEFIKKRISYGAVYDPPIHLQPIYKEKFGYKKGLLPNTEDVASRLLALPLFVEMKYVEQKKVIDTIIKII